MPDRRDRVVGFFPFFANLAATSRLVRIAERYRELGGRAVFFSHGGYYEALEAIETILEGYDRYRARAEALADRLPVVDGARRGAERLQEILGEL